VKASRVFWKRVKLEARVEEALMSACVERRGLEAEGGEPIAVAMGDFLEAATGPVEQGVGLRPALDGPRFQTVGPGPNQVAC
jgi:hypothetical protein